MAATSSAFASAEARELSAAEAQANPASPHISTAQAERNLAIQHRGTKVDIVDQLREGLGRDYAGLWFDTEAGEFVVPIATGGRGKSATEGREAATAKEFAAASLAGDYRTEVVDFSRSELETAQLALDEKLSSYFKEGLVQSALDPSVDAVIVRVPSSIGDATLVQLEQTVKGIGVAVEVRKLPDSVFEAAPTGCNEAIRKCDLPVRGGEFIYGGPFGGNLYEICSAAFRANGYDGRKYILTAGHCAKENSGNGNPIWSWIAQDPSGNSHSIGTLSQWHYPGKDWAKIDATGSWADTPPWPTILAYWGATQEYPVVGEAKSYKGQTLCHIGANTGASCGIVREEGVNVEYDDGNKLNSMFEVVGQGLALGGGDSGGPVIANNIALGITSGGFSAYSNAILYFSDITAATSELNVNIAGAGAPEAITGSATNVQPFQATANGQVNPHGLSTSYRFEYGKGSYTNSTPDYSGGASQEFSAVSATLPGLEMRTTYQYRIRASNSLNTAYGTEGTFTTPGIPPQINYEGYSPRVDPTSITLNASINPMGASTTYQWQWGETTSYGNVSPAQPEGIGSGTGPVHRSLSLSGLEPEKVYHYRIVATNQDGTTVGPDRLFSTLARTPTLLSAFGSAGTGNGQFNRPLGTAVDTSGNVYVVDRENNRVSKFNSKGEFLSQFGSAGSGNGQFKEPRSVAIGPNGTIWVTDAGNARVEEFNANGEYLLKLGPEAGGNKLSGPYGIAVDNEGRVWVSDSSANKVVEYKESAPGVYPFYGEATTVDGVAMSTPAGLGLDAAGDVWIAETGANRISELEKTPSGFVGHLRFGASGSGQGQLSQPYDVKVKPSGNLFVVDRGNNRVQQFSPNGEFQASFGATGSGSGQFNEPSGVAVGLGGVIYVTDSGNKRVERWGTE
jgi:streptogramin lyase